MGRFVNINRDPRAEFRAVSAPNADNVAIAEGITGQFYIAILVARLVGDADEWLGATVSLRYQKP
jgi:hypothetical protein